MPTRQEETHRLNFGNTVNDFVVEHFCLDLLFAIAKLLYELVCLVHVQHQLDLTLLNYLKKRIQFMK